MSAFSAFVAKDALEKEPVLSASASNPTLQLTRGILLTVGEAPAGAAGFSFRV